MRPFIALLILAFPSHSAPPCAQTIQGLRALVGDAAFPLRWHETSMDDGRPLVMSIHERGGQLFLTFIKQREGMWAEGAGAVCAKDGRLEARFAPEQMNIGPAAHWAMRYSLANGADFTLTRIEGGSMKVSTVGWSGIFAAREAD